MRKLQHKILVAFALVVFLAPYMAYHLRAQAPGSGSCLDYALSTDYLSIPHNNTLMPTAAITLEAWIKADSWSPNSWGNVIISKDGWGSGEGGYTLRCGANGVLSFNLGTTTSWKEVTTPAIMQLGTWYHVAGTFDGTSLRAFINGVPYGSFSYTGAILATTYAVAIGRITYTAGGTRNFDGQIDEVRIWNSALSNATLQQWMTKKVTPSHPNYANLVGYWKMDEGTGATCADSSPNGFTGTRNGTTWATSAAAIGDDNAVIYGTPTTVSLTNSDGSSFTASGISGSPTGFHVYAVHQTPNVTTENLSGALETTHYFGTYIVGGTNPAYTATYDYTGVTGLASSGQEEDIRLTSRSNNAGTLWSRLGNQFHTDTLANTVYRCGITGRREFAAGFDSTEYAITASTICQGDTLNYFGQPLTTAGVYTHVTTGTNGCDSIIGVRLSVLPAVTGSDSATICSGDSVVLGGQVMSSTGTYQLTLTAVNGCDSILAFSLTVTPPMVTSIADTICDGDTYTLGSQSLTQPGTYSEVFSAVDGCDSLVTLSLAIHAVDTSVTVSGNVITANLSSPSYQWLSCDNGFGVIPGQTGQSFTVGSNGNYAVIVSDGICSDTSGCHFVLAVRRADRFETLLRAYPNPSGGLIHLQVLRGIEVGAITVLNLQGELMDVGVDRTGGDPVVDMRNLAAGMYFLSVRVDGQEVRVRVARN